MIKLDQAATEDYGALSVPTLALFGNGEVVVQRSEFAPLPELYSRVGGRL